LLLDFHALVQEYEVLKAEERTTDIWWHSTGWYQGAYM